MQFWFGVTATVTYLRRSRPVRSGRTDRCMWPPYAAKMKFNLAPLCHLPGRQAVSAAVHGRFGNLIADWWVLLMSEPIERTD